MNANANKAPFKQGFRIEINHILFFLILPHEGHLNKNSQGYEVCITREVTIFVQVHSFLLVALCMHIDTSYKLKES